MGLYIDLLEVSRSSGPLQDLLRRAKTTRETREEIVWVQARILRCANIRPRRRAPLGSSARSTLVRFVVPPGQQPPTPLGFDSPFPLHGSPHAPRVSMPGDVSPVDSRLRLRCPGPCWGSCDPSCVTSQGVRRRNRQRRALPFHPLKGLRPTRARRHPTSL